jgi:hypothetical protein
MISTLQCSLVDSYLDKTYRNGLVCLLFRASGYIYGGIFLVEDLGKLMSTPSISASDDVDLSCTFLASASPLVNRSSTETAPLTTLIR